MSTESPAAAPAAVWGISYRGAVRPEAEDLKRRFELAGAPISQPQELKQTDAKLGAEEIIITMIASAALKAVSQVAFQQLRDYLVQRITDKEKENKKQPNLQVVMKKNATDSGKRELLSLRVATVQTIDKFIDNLSDAALKAVDSLAGG